MTKDHEVNSISVYVCIEHLINFLNGLGVLSNSS